MGTFLIAHFDALLAAMLTLLAALLPILATPKVRLRSATPHQFTFLVPEPHLDASGNVISPTSTVQTQSVYIINSGRQTATDVEVVFNWKPPVWNLWPLRDYKDKTSPDGRFIITFASLAPKESFQLELLAVNAGLPNLLNVRANEREGKHQELQWNAVISKGRVRTVLALMALGAFTLLYALIYAGQAAYRQLILTSPPAVEATRTAPVGT